MNNKRIERHIKKYGEEKLLEGKLLAFNDILRFLLDLELPAKNRLEIITFIEYQVKEIERRQNENE